MPGCPVLPILLTYPPVFLQPCFHGNRWCVPPSAQAVWPVQFQFLTERSAPVPFPKETSVIQRVSKCNTRPDYHTSVIYWGKWYYYWWPCLVPKPRWQQNFSTLSSGVPVLTTSRIPLPCLANRFSRATGPWTFYYKPFRPNAFQRPLSLKTALP